MARTIYILDVKNEWWIAATQTTNNRNSLCYRIFDTEDAAKGYMAKFIDTAMSKEKDINPTITEVRDKQGIVSIECSFNAGFDAIANNTTYTSVKVYRREIQDDVPEDPF
nr:hypothetical protein [Bacteroidales bacterium]